MAAKEPSRPGAAIKNPDWLTSLVLFGGFGALQALCFDQQPSLWLPWIAWVPVAWLALESRWSLALRVVAGWSCGTVFWAFNVSWLAHTMGEHGGLPKALAWGLLGLLALYMGLYWAVLVAVGSLLRQGSKGVRRSEQDVLARTPGGILLGTVGLAAAWVLLEIVREWMFTGFPWTPVGESLVRTPGALDAAAWIGVRGLSFVVLWVNVALAQFLQAQVSLLRRESRNSETGQLAYVGAVRTAWFLGGSIVLVILGLASASWHARYLQVEQAQKIAGAESPRSLPVRIVQPNIPIGATAEETVRNYHRLLRLSQCGPERELIVWPESAAYPHMWRRSLSLQRDVTEALDSRCSLLFNTSMMVRSASGETGFSNTALLATPPAETQSAKGVAYAGTTDVLATQRYDKMHLVPYGEYVPLADLLPFVSQLARSVGSFEPGSEINLLHWRKVMFGVSICFEVLFPKEVTEQVRLGATALVTVTNDAWFGDTRGPRQHLVSARFRAAENRRPLVFAAITGVSAAINSRGRIVKSLPWGTADSLSLDLTLDLGHTFAAELTFYTRRPWALDFAALVLFGLALVLVRRW